MEIVRFFQEEFYIYIHYDTKGTIAPEEVTALRAMRNVRLVASRYSINWGGYNVLKGVIYLMRMAAKEGLADYYHLISGQDFPTKSPEEFKVFFEQHKGTEFLDYFSLPYKGWTNGGLDRLTTYHFFDYCNCKVIGKWTPLFNKLYCWQSRYHITRKLPLKRYPVLYGGYCWWSLTRECVQYVVDETNRHPYLLRRLRFTFAPDELYVQTILLYSPFRAKIEKDNLRYIDWNFRNGNYPANLDETDYPKINASNKIFARKIKYPISDSLMEILRNRQSPEMQTEELPISVILIFCNAAASLIESVDSILNQSFCDFELILIDDGSTDEGLSVARSYSDPRIRIIENKHNRIDSLNLGIQAARGKYITQLDANDRMTFERLSKQYQFMELHPEIDVCGAWFQIFGNEIKTTLQELPQKNDEILLSLIREKNPMGHSTALFRRDFLLKNQIQYDSDALYAEDIQLWVDIIKAGGILENLPYCLHECRQSNPSDLSMQNAQLETAYRIYFDFLEYVMNQLGEQNEKLWEVMEQMIVLLNDGIIPFNALRDFVSETYIDSLSHKNADLEEVV